MLLKKYRNKIKISRCNGISFVRLRTMPGSGGYQLKCNFCRLWDACKGCLGCEIKQDILFYENLGDYCKARIGMFHIPFKYIKNLKDVIQEGPFI